MSHNGFIQTSANSGSSSMPAHAPPVRINTFWMPLPGYFHWAADLNFASLPQWCTPPLYFLFNAFWSFTDQVHGVTGQNSRCDLFYELEMASYIAVIASTVAAELTETLPPSTTVLQYFPFYWGFNLARHRFNCFVPHWIMRKDCISFDNPSHHDVLLHRCCHDRRGIIW